MAQASKAIIPKDAGGPFGQIIGVSVGGSVGWALRVGAYVTGRSSSSDWSRYSIVVMNCGSLASLMRTLPINHHSQGMIMLRAAGILNQFRQQFNSEGCRFVQSRLSFFLAFLIGDAVGQVHVPSWYNDSLVVRTIQLECRSRVAQRDRSGSGSDSWKE